MRNKDSGSLRRIPSAPTYVQSPPLKGHQHSRSSHASSNSSLEKPSPNLTSPEFGAPAQTGAYTSSPRFSTRESLSEKSSDELIGAPFKSLTPVDSNKTSGYQNSLRRPGPPPLSHSHTSPDPRILTPSLRQSASFSIGDGSLDITPPRSDTGLITPKRYSDETNGSRNSMWKKKGGFSNFMNSVLGSPRTVKISAPENPVHVTHVGYDNETGQFTVRYSIATLQSPIGMSAFSRVLAHCCTLCLMVLDDICARVYTNFSTGPSQRMAKTAARERYFGERAGAKSASNCGHYEILPENHRES